MMRQHLVGLISFGLIGVIGFIVDSSVLYLFVFELGAGLYLSRVFSYLSAATVTWWLNRHFTFLRNKHANGLAEWVRFLFFNLGGGSVNYGVYSVMVATYPLVAEHPVMGVAAGSLAGMVINYVLSNLFVFTSGDRAVADRR